MFEIGKNIAARRKELGMTQEELAAKMGYKSKSSINKLELGKADLPQSKIAKFAKVLETTPACLMGWEKVQKNNDTISDIIVRLRSDSDFLSVVEDLNKLDGAKLQAVKQMLSAFIQ